MDHHVQEDLVLVHLVTKLLYLLLPISGSHTELVYFLGQIDLGKFFAQVLRFDLLLVNLVILLTLRKVFIIFLSPLIGALLIFLDSNAFIFGGFGAILGYAHFLRSGPNHEAYLLGMFFLGLFSFFLIEQIYGKLGLLPDIVSGILIFLVRILNNMDHLF
jgi:hypothetical protein